jgi:hypothetical protein
VSAVAWGAIVGTITDQSDLGLLLAGKLSTVATFGGDISGSYDSISISDDSHNHTGSTISGLASTNFTTANISQWTNDAGYLTGVSVSNYKPNNVACTDGQILKYDAANTQWICGNDNTAEGTSTGGGVVASITTAQTRAQTVYSAPATSTGVEISELTLTFTPKKAGNKVILEWVVSGEAGSLSDLGFVVTRNGIILPNATNATGNQWAIIANSPYDVDFDSTPYNLTVKIIDENSLDVPSTYRLIARSTYSSALTFMLNRTLNNPGQQSYEATLSTAVATEFDPTGTSGGSSSITVGSMTGATLFADATADNSWLGLGATAGRIEFDDLTVDEINFLNTNVGINTSTPLHTLDVNGNIGISASSYINFGSLDGLSGYGFRDNGGVIEAKDSTGEWSKIVTEAPSNGINYMRKDGNWSALPTSDYILIREEEPAGTAGGTCTAGSWITRILNTEVTDSANHATIASNQITLQPGTYRIQASAPAYAVNQNQTRFYNITDSATTIVGSSEYAAYSSGNYASSTRSTVNGQFTIIDPKTFELQHRCTTTIAGSGFGSGNSFGEVQIYSIVELWKTN